MNVYFVRHGQSVGNVNGTYQSGSVKLSAHGLKQAQTVANRFKNIAVDIIFSSDYERAAKTAEQIGIVTQKEVIHTPLLREVKRPSVVEGKSHHDENINRLKQTLDDHAHDPQWHHSDEENIHDLIKRAQKCLDFISSRKEENIVVVSHGNFLRTLIGTMMFGDRMSVENYGIFFKFAKHQNTGITLCKNIDGVWKLITWNDHAHLG